MTPKNEELDDKLESFLASLPTIEDELLSWVGGLGRPDLLPLDFTLESLDRVESLFALVLDKVIPLPEGVALGQLVTSLVGYVGHTIIRAIGGAWDITDSKKEPYSGNPAIAEIPKLSRTFRVYPIQVLVGFQKWRQRGSVRRQIEKHDLAARERRAARLEANLDSLLESLGRRLGTTLDFSPASLDRVERAYGEQLDALGSGRAPMRDEVEMYAGEVVRRARGDAWRLCSDPNRGELGELCVGAFVPSVVLQNFELRRQSGLLKSATEAALQVPHPA